MRKTILRRLSVLSVFICLAVVQLACSSKQATNVNGTYSFDAQTFQDKLKSTDDPVLKNMPAEVLNQTVEQLKNFKIDVQDDQATATFGAMVVKGTLTKQGEENGEVKYIMTPVDEDKKNDTVVLVIKGDQLTLDPGKKESDKMFFKKTS